MIPDAIDQAKTRLTDAEEALNELVLATNFKQAERAWRAYLVAVNSIYAKLEQGAKGDTKSDTWYGNKKHERIKDPLLSYLHQARNSDQHSIAITAGQTPPNTDGMGRQLKFNERTELFKFQAHDPKTGKLNAEGEGLFAGPTLKPLKVRNRGVDYEPPRQHLGKEIPFCDFADGLAKHAIPYLKSLIAEAETLVRK